MYIFTQRYHSDYSMPELLNGKEYIRKLITIAYLNIGFPLLLFIWVYLEVSSDLLNSKIDPTYHLTVFISVLLLALATILLGLRKYKLQILLSGTTDVLAEKLEYYKKGLTARFISYAIASFAITLAYYFTTFKPFEALFGIMIVLFSIHSPNARRVVTNLKLKKEDRLIILEGRDF